MQSINKQHSLDSRQRSLSQPQAHQEIKAFMQISSQVHRDFPEMQTREEDGERAEEEKELVNELTSRDRRLTYMRYY
jgi:hypothetical protein